MIQITASSFILFREPYGPHPLQTMDIHLPSYKLRSLHDKKWIIFIHGGAWRDPSNSKADATRLLHAIIHTPNNTTLCGATLNYRLSPSDREPGNNARHPDHIADVLTGITFLQQKYQFGRNYILVGHSAGATLALQSLRSIYNGRNIDSAIPSAVPFLPGGLPRAVVCTEGIYNLLDLVDEYPQYTSFVENAFGPPSRVWFDASPTCLPGWKSEYDGRIVILQSTEDELLSLRQATGFVKALEAEGVNVDVEIVGGRHDDVFKGEELVVVVKKVLGEMNMDMKELAAALDF
ncbi:hypothetical protein TWF569_011941 [Orbilia oligospora]|uniref:Kynurenine formamidase n=1 Tax=Orbilia oligospora TaxID=2813651 RepID=A0A7C8IWL4_ORBOL|nr:hypothetical protein TWF102_003301 [Orbilia oligospora]KAF3081012.1 hypothetical protein TWF706_002417 [Orbilia oligospora]KAF3112395.1 hypothetical protein TWF103_003179 [Orbilia oligospora]KAF3123109.1 hypothetical protein TWF594_002520 [Orbilia oligospora]KAF3126932.1 hypothetical protein TWF569_011941 [Orbilia oligospora]